MAFWTSSGLQKLAQSESGGRANLVHYPPGSGVKSSASGLYGFLDSTWRQQATQAGVDTSLYPRAYQAPAAVQTQVAALTPTSHWTCPGCNSTATRLANDPANVSGSPESGGFTSGDQGGSSLTYDPAQQGGDNTGSAAGSEGNSGYIFNPDTGTYFNPNTGDVKPPGTPGLNPPAGPGTGEGTPGDLGTSGTGGLPQILTYFWDKILRLSLIVLGVVLVAVAAWAMARGEFKTA